MSLWETFQYIFDGFTKENFTLVRNNNQQRLWDYLQKYGIRIQKQPKYLIARSLYDALLEEELKDWIEAMIMVYKLKDEFAFYYIK